MNRNEIAGAVGITVGAAITLSAIFVWGMAVGTNDTRALASYDQRMEMAARGVCGPRAQLARTDAGGYVCIYTNPDGATLARPVLDHPIEAR